MARFTLDAHQRSPQGKFGGEELPGDQAGPHYRFVAPGNLGGERQEQFVQTAFCEEAGKQLRAALGKDQITWARSLRDFQDSSRAQFTTRALPNGDYFG